MRTLVLSLAIAIAAMASSMAGADTLKVTASEWPPYVDKTLHENGFVVALVAAVMEQAGYPTTWTLRPWPNSLEATQKGYEDLIAGVWLSEDRAKTLTFSKPIVTNRIVFLKRRSSDIRFDTLSDLQGLMVGIVQDYAYGDKVYGAKSFKKSQTGSVLANLRKLIAGDIDLVLADERVALYELNKNLAKSVKEVEVLPRPFVTKELRIAVSKKRPDHQKIAADFDKAFAKMKNDGSLFPLLSKYRVSLD